MGTYYDSTTGRTYTYTGSFANGTAVFVDEVPPTAGGNYSGGGSGGSGGGSTNNTTNTTPKPTITGKLDSTPTGSQSTILTGEEAGTTFTADDITPIKPSSPSTPVTPTPTDNTAGNTDNTNNILNTPLAETIISAVTGNEIKPDNTNSVSRPAQHFAQSIANTQKNQANVYNPTDFVIGSAPAFVGQFNYLHNAKDKNGDDIALKTLSNAEAANVIYNDVDAGIYRFDSKAEANKFLQTLHENDYDFGDIETEFYDAKGNFVGFLGQDAYPYAVVVPEQRNVDVQLFLNTGGYKGGSPAKKGNSSWTDTPSPKKTSELSEDFDFIYSSRNNTNAEIRDLLELKGIDESWYDGKVGQNPLGGYTGSGRDARESTIKISDVKSGKTTAVQLMDNFGSSDIAEINYGFKIKTLPKTHTAEKVKRDPYADGIFSVPTQDDTILNSPFEIIGTLIGVGALAKAANVGGKIGGNADRWVSTGGKTMDGFNIVSHSTRPILGGSRGGKAAEFVTKTDNRYKLAEIGFGAGIGGIFAGKEIESGNIDFSEIIPQSAPQELESGLIFSAEVIPTEYKSELSVNTNPQNPFSINAGSLEVERVREKEKTKQKDEGFSYADIPTYTTEEKIRLAKEAYAKQREQEIEWEREQEKQRQKTKEEYSVVNEAELPPVILEIGGKNPVIEIGGKENIIHDKQRENVSEFEKIIHGREHEHTRENMFGDWSKWAEQTRNLERNSLIQSNNFRINNSEMVSNRFSHSSPYLFDFVNDNQNEDKRRRKDRDERRKRTGSGEINFYRTVVPVGDFGLFRESKREKSRKIGTENYSFIEIDGHRKTKRTRKMKPQQRQNFGGFRPIKPFGGFR